MYKIMHKNIIFVKKIAKNLHNSNIFCNFAAD